MHEEMAVLQASRNQVAVRHGLPPVGAVMVNKYGIEWLVDGHLYLPTLSTIARQGVDCGDSEDPQDLYPVILPQNLSVRLTEFIAETSRCTSKSIMPVDTTPALRPQSAHAEGYSVDGQTSPYRIVVFLDAAHVHETIFAHEIGHIWIDLVEDCEDYRILKDLSNPARVFQWTNIQSFVLDMKVNKALREKGFDMSIIESHVEEALASLSLAVLSGYRPPEPREAAFLATTLAAAMLDRETGTTSLPSLDMAAMVFERDLPGVYELACHLAASVRKHGYHSRASIRKAIDECASLSFRYIGEPLALERDLVEETPEECGEDKYPEWFPGLSVAAKLEIGKAMARQRIPAGAEYRLSYTSDGRAHIQFAQASGEWTAPTLLHHPHRLSQNTAVAGSSHSLPKGSATMNTSKSSSVPVQQPALPPFGNVARRRTYTPGLAVFLSRTRLAEQLRGEHPYGYANNNPVRYIDPSGNNPTIQPGCKELTDVQAGLNTACQAITSAVGQACINKLSPKYKTCINSFCTSNASVTCGSPTCANDNCQPNCRTECCTRGHGNGSMADKNCAIFICTSVIEAPRCLRTGTNGSQNIAATILHEAMHCCGMLDHSRAGSRSDPYNPAEDVARCIMGLPGHEPGY